MLYGLLRHGRHRSHVPSQTLRRKTVSIPGEVGANSGEMWRKASWMEDTTWRLEVFQFAFFRRR